MKRKGKHVRRKITKASAVRRISIDDFRAVATSISQLWFNYPNRMHIYTSLIEHTGAISHNILAVRKRGWGMIEQQYSEKTIPDLCHAQCIPCHNS